MKLILLRSSLLRSFAVGKSEGISNGLSGELKLRIFQEVVEEDDECVNEGEFLGFAVGHETVVNRFEDRVVTGGRARRPSRSDTERAYLGRPGGSWSSAEAFTAFG